MQKINFYLVSTLFFAASSLSLNGMFVSAITKRLKTTSTKRDASFVRLKKYPGKVVRLDREFPTEDIYTSSCIVVKNRFFPGSPFFECRVIKLDNLTAEEEEYANAYGMAEHPHVNWDLTAIYDEAEVINPIDAVSKL